MSANKLNYISFTQNELSEIFTSAREGNSQAFEKLSVYIRDISISYFLSKLRSGKLPSRDDAEDLTNNVYLAFAEQYQKIENLEFWLRRVLFLTFVNFYKKNKVHKTLQFDETFYDAKNGNDAGSNVDAEKVLKILDTMSGDKQQILKLRFWKDLKFSEIAEIMNKSEVAVKKMFYRTIEDLKGKL